MCYSNSSTSTTQQLAERYQKLIPHLPIELRYYVASGFHFPNWHIITNDATLQQMQWGLLPQWFRGSNRTEFASKTLNARQESCHQKASFKHLLDSKRCLVPSTGFFEWQSLGQVKIPHFIKDMNQAIFSMAGLYDLWLNPQTGIQESTFTILTTEANELMATIHNTKKRMPLILHPSEEADWLSAKVGLDAFEDRSGISLQAWPVDKRILLSPDANQASVQQRYIHSIGEQKGLFD